jgi:Holliday junction resolvase
MLQESLIERRLKKEIEKIGGKAIKFVSPGMSGVPDRIVLLPEGRIYFVELKASGKKLKAIQEYRAKELRGLGFNVRTIDSIEKIHEFIEELLINDEIR